MPGVRLDIISTDDDVGSSDVCVARRRRTGVHIAGRLAASRRWALGRNCQFATADWVHSSACFGRRKQSWRTALVILQKVLASSLEPPWLATMSTLNSVIGSSRSLKLRNVGRHRFNLIEQACPVGSLRDSSCPTG